MLLGAIYKKLHVIHTKLIKFAKFRHKSFGFMLRRKSLKNVHIFTSMAKQLKADFWKLYMTEYRLYLGKTIVFVVQHLYYLSKDMLKQSKNRLLLDLFDMG